MYVSPGDMWACSATIFTIHFMTVVQQSYINTIVMISYMWWTTELDDFNCQKFSNSAESDLTQPDSAFSYQAGPKMYTN